MNRSSESPGDKTLGTPTAVTARAYGQSVRDLNIAFSTQPRPALITEILSVCLQLPDGRALTEAEMWGWTLERRIQALLAVVVATGGRQVTTTTRCTHVDCAQPIELDLDLSDFTREHPREACEWVATDGSTLIIRPPTGRDQLDWLAASRREGTCLPVSMASDLVVSINGQSPSRGWRVPEERLDEIGKHLARYDPLTVLQLDVECPSCLRQLRVDLDLTDVLVRQLAEVQTKLLDEIHRLATAYHWSEEQIVSIPSWRRTYYLKRVNAEVGG